MILKQGDIEVEGDADGCSIADEREGAMESPGMAVLDADEMRWLAMVAIPAMLATPGERADPSDTTENVEPPIPGQTTIDEVLDVR